MVGQGPMNLARVRLLQFQKALPPIVVTFLGMTTELRAEQFINASSPMEVRLSGRVREAMLAQSRKAYLTTEDSPSGSVTVSRAEQPWKA